MPDHFPIPIVQMPLFVKPDTVESALPLDFTDVKVEITGPLVNVKVRQHFKNLLTEPAELDYLFPLPEDAAITGFEMQVGARHILGDLQECDVARAAYEDARGQGKRTGLFEMRRANLFALRLANILPGEGIDTSVSYQQRVSYSDGKFEFVYPMGLTPKYDRPQNLQEGEGVHAPVAMPGEKIGPVTIEVLVDSGFPTGEPSSPSHILVIVREDDHRFQVHLPEKQYPDHDFILRYPLKETNVVAAAWTSGEPGKEFFLATVVPPRMEKEPQVPPRDFIFVLDRSGSMTGEPIAQARNALRACLRSLNPADTFRILLFDNQLEWFRNEPAFVTQELVDLADAYLGKVQGRGGTEIILALEAVLSLPEDLQRTRYIVFLTDGAVSAEAQALERIRARVGPARLFTFGVGPSVNRALLSRMARLGRGRSVFLQLDEDIEGAIIQFQDSVSFPVLTGLSLHCENGKVWDVYPSRLPDLYYGEPLEISGRLSRVSGQTARLSLQGEQEGQSVALFTDLVPPVRRELALERVWAQAKVEDLLEQQEMDPARAQKIRADILGLALDAGLVTPYTSYIAVDQEVTQSGVKPRRIKIALPLPKGLDPEGFVSQPGISRKGMVMSASFLPPAMPSALVSRQAAGKPLQSLMSKLSGKMVKDSAQGVGNDGAPQAGLRKGDTILRWLARTQKMDGSWDEDVERSAVALIAFVRSGQTTRSGSYRQALLRLVSWLVVHRGTGFSAFIRVLGLEELARATGDDNDSFLARAGRQALGLPDSILDRAALGEPVHAPSSIQSLDDLRLAGILKIPLPIPSYLLRGNDADLASIWSATLPDR